MIRHAAAAILVLLVPMFGLAAAARRERGNEPCQQSRFRDRHPFRLDLLRQ